MIHDLSVFTFKLPTRLLVLCNIFTGDPRYRVKYLSVNDVRAVTLKVSDISLREFPLSYILVLTAGNPAVEYQLDTYIEGASPFTFDQPLDEIRWVALPQTPIIFSYHGYMSVTCVVILDSESDKLDELNMYRVTFKNDEPEEKSRRNKGFMNTPNPDPGTEVRNY